MAAGEGVIGDLADISAADGRSFAAGACSRLGLHLGVTGDDDVIGVVGVAGRRIRVYLAAFRACAVADACRAGAGGIQFFIHIAARGRHLAAGNFDVAARAVHTAADTGSALAAHGLYRAAGDFDVAAGALHSAADACAAVVAALGGEGAVLALVVLDGQGALWLVAILLEARIVAAALQLVVAVQLDGHISIALDPDSSFALIAGVDLQVVEGDVHVAAGGVDGDGVLLRLAGDDGVGVLHILLALCDPVRAFGVARLHGDVAVGDVPLGRIGRDAGAYHDARDDGGGYAPPDCAFQSHSLSPFVLCIMQCRRCGSGAPCEGSRPERAVAYPPRERWPQIGKPAVSGTRQARFSAFPLSQARATNPNSGGRPFFSRVGSPSYPALVSGTRQARFPAFPLSQARATNPNSGGRPFFSRVGSPSPAFVSVIRRVHV